MNIDALTESFKMKYEKFIIGCDAQEELAEWDTECNGEMDVYYENDLVGIILTLVVADGAISQKEVDYLNRCFGFDYTVETLEEVYKTCSSELDDLFCNRFSEGVEQLRGINEKLADAYVELVDIACDIIIASDDVIATSETEAAKALKATLK